MAKRTSKVEKLMKELTHEADELFVEAEAQAFIKKAKVSDVSKSLTLSPDLKYPKSLTTLTGEQVSQFLSNFSSAAAWVNHNIQLLEARILFQKRAERIYRDSETARLKSEVKGIRPAEIEETINGDRDLNIWRAGQARDEVILGHLKARFAFFDQSSKALSRELTRRVAGADGKFRAGGGSIGDQPGADDA